MNTNLKRAVFALKPFPNLYKTYFPASFCKFVHTSAGNFDKKKQQEKCDPKPKDKCEPKPEPKDKCDPKPEPKEKKCEEKKKEKKKEKWHNVVIYRYNPHTPKVKPRTQTYKIDLNK